MAFAFVNAVLDFFAETLQCHVHGIRAGHVAIFRPLAHEPRRLHAIESINRRVLLISLRIRPRITTHAALPFFDIADPRGLTARGTHLEISGEKVRIEVRGSDGSFEAVGLHEQRIGRVRAEALPSDGETIGIGVALLDDGVDGRHDRRMDVFHQLAGADRNVRLKHCIATRREHLWVERRQRHAQSESIEHSSDALARVHPHERGESLACLIAGRQQQGTFEILTAQTLERDALGLTAARAIELGIEIAQLPSLLAVDVIHPDVREMFRIAAEIGYEPVTRHVMDERIRRLLTARVCDGMTT